MCVDIDECSNTNICDENAECNNELGGYSCRCRNGFVGNGFICQRISDRIDVPSQTETEEPERQSETSPSTEASEESQDVSTEGPGSTTTSGVVVTEKWFCDQCSDNAECFQGVCVCKNGWNGDGYDCIYNCPADFVWSIDRCVPINTSEEEERR